MLAVDLILKRTVSPRLTLIAVANPSMARISRRRARPTHWRAHPPGSSRTRWDWSRSPGPVSRGRPGAPRLPAGSEKSTRGGTSCHGSLRVVRMKVIGRHWRVCVPSCKKHTSSRPRAQQKGRHMQVDTLGESERRAEQTGARLAEVLRPRRLLFSDGQTNGATAPLEASPVGPDHVASRLLREPSRSIPVRTPRPLSARSVADRCGLFAGPERRPPDSGARDRPAGSENRWTWSTSSNRAPRRSARSSGTPEPKRSPRDSPVSRPRRSLSDWCSRRHLWWRGARRSRVRARTVRLDRARSSDRTHRLGIGAVLRRLPGAARGVDAARADATDTTRCSAGPGSRISRKSGHSKGPASS